MNIFFSLDFPGGILFKVYVIGDAIRVVRRFSLPDVEGQGGNGVMPFPRVSNAAATADNADLDPEVAGKFIEFLLRLCIIYVYVVNSILFSECRATSMGASEFSFKGTKAPFGRTRYFIDMF